MSSNGRNMSRFQPEYQYTLLPTESPSNNTQLLWLNKVDHWINAFQDSLNNWQQRYLIGDSEVRRNKNELYQEPVPQRTYLNANRVNTKIQETAPCTANIH